jgi:hypothetical protein
MFIQLDGKQDYKVLYNLAMAHEVCVFNGNLNCKTSWQHGCSCKF